MNVFDWSTDALRQFDNPMCLLRRLVVTSVEETDPAALRLIKAVSKQHCEELCGPGLYVPTTLGSLLGPGNHTVVLVATEGSAFTMDRSGGVRAVYGLQGLANYSSESIAAIKKRADIDFEGTIELRVADADHQLTRLPSRKRGEAQFVNRFSGDQSEFFSLVEQFGLYAPSSVCAPELCHDTLMYETPHRFGVSTRRRRGTEPCDPAELRNSVSIGEGILIWPSNERRSDRYGCVQLIEQPVEGSPHVTLDLGDIMGHRGKLVAEVLESRETPHVGDIFRWIFPSTPEVGELVELGTGTIVAGDDDSVGCQPDDGRIIDWLNPKALYRCQWQTVRLHFMPIH